MVTGPRAAGKTTTAARSAATTVRLDQPAQAAAFRADPDAALSALTGPILLDEWQEVPEVLGAVRRAVERNGRAGRFILTGSVRTDRKDQTWPGTGRLVRLQMYGLTIREQVGKLVGDTFLARLSRADIRAFELPSKVPTLPDYIELALRGGFPEPIIQGYSEEALRRWLASYIDQLITHDVPGVVRDPGRLRRFFDVMALNTAGVPTDVTIREAADVQYRTAERFETLLGDVFVLDNVPAYAGNRLQRMVKLPKRYIVEPALAGASLRMDRKAILGDADLFGRLLDTFVMAQIRPELALEAAPPRLYHLRDANGRREVDIVSEHGARSVTGIEVKASAAPGVDDAKHLIFLRDRLKDRFLAGAVLHTGPSAFELAPRIFALPICSIWGQDGRALGLRAPPAGPEHP
jgi:predicted AAA+ superfamily ATPase